MEQGWVTINQAARASGIERHLVRLWAKQGRFLVRKVDHGGLMSWEINQADFSNYARLRGYKVQW